MEPFGLSGLDNLGNTCYLNSILQILSNTTELKNFILNDVFINIIYKLDSNPIELLSFQLYKLVQTMWKKNDNYEPESIIELLDKKIDFINIKEQNDSHEILIHILEHMDKELKIPCKINILNTNNNKLLQNTICDYQYKLYKNNSKINDLFQFIIIYEDVCKKTKITNYSLQEQYILSLHLNENNTSNENSEELNSSSDNECHTEYYGFNDSDEDVNEECFEINSNEDIFDNSSSNSDDNLLLKKLNTINVNKKEIVDLYALLNNYFENETIDDVFCNICKKNITKNRNIYIWKLPKILIFHINKEDKQYNFKYKYPLELDMTRYVHPDNTNDKIYKYELYSINIRIRFGFESGHYYSCCKNINDWYMFNDNSVRKIDDINEIDEDINMLFYRIV